MYGKAVSPVPVTFASECNLQATAENTNPRRASSIGRRALLQCIKRGEDFITVTVRTYIHVRALDSPIGTDNECMPRRHLRDAQIPERPIYLRDLMAGVRQQLEIQPFFDAELLV